MDQVANGELSPCAGGQISAKRAAKLHSKQMGGLQAHQQTSPSGELEQPSGQIIYNQKKVAMSVMSSNSNKHNINHNIKAS